MIEYKYKKRENKFTENGHTMFEVDVLQRLKRLADLEDQIKQGQLLPRKHVSNTEGKVCVVCGKTLTRSEANGGNCCDICWLSN